ncbi:four helix bundle protein [Chryseobacterium taklimakanense]|uniref:Four helix bundle protein n=1 Tax=Chryseobacterium taklimakanense TaxID=536441 RepID=A0A239WJE9_9FLAO|nr:four helix bundle protein [Chryseobacterium taklimakanense]SNV34587.1 four helix bundle protein [Chryseobacterium taklimakanense]
MKPENTIRDKSFDFALMIIELFKICKSQNEFVISKQLLRSGTSIGANVQEATAGFSKKDFLYKMAIASKEARETQYWILLLSKSKLVVFNEEKYLTEIQSIVNILTSIVKTTSENLNNT